MASEIIGTCLFILIFIIGSGVIFGWKASVWVVAVLLGFSVLITLLPDDTGTSSGPVAPPEPDGGRTVQRDFTGRIIPAFGEYEEIKHYRCNDWGNWITIEVQITRSGYTIIKNGWAVAQADQEGSIFENELDARCRAGEMFTYLEEI